MQTPSGSCLQEHPLLKLPGLTQCSGLPPLNLDPSISQQRLWQPQRVAASRGVPCPCYGVPQSTLAAPGMGQFKHTALPALPKNYTKME